MKTLNEITEELLKINDLIESSIDEHGEINAALADDLAAWFAMSLADRAAKLDAYLGLIREKEMRAVAAKAQKEQWAQKQKSEEDGVEWLKKKLFDHLKLMGDTKVQTASGRTIAIQKNGGEVPLIIDEEKFNSLEECQLKELENRGLIVMEPMLSKALVRRSLQHGSDLHKAVLSPFAKLGERGESLRIR